MSTMLPLPALPPSNPAALRCAALDAIAGLTACCARAQQHVASPVLAKSHDQLHALAAALTDMNINDPAAPSRLLRAMQLVSEIAAIAAKETRLRTSYPDLA